MTGVIVTGGASGIGAACCAALRAGGREVTAADLASGDGVERLDVADEGSWAELFDRVGPVDGLVNYHLQQQQAIRQELEDVWVSFNLAPPSGRPWVGQVMLWAAIQPRSVCQSNALGAQASESFDWVKQIVDFEGQAAWQMVCPVDNQDQFDRRRLLGRLRSIQDVADEPLATLSPRTAGIGVLDSERDPMPIFALPEVLPPTPDKPGTRSCSDLG